MLAKNKKKEKKTKTYPGWKSFRVLRGIYKLAMLECILFSAEAMPGIKIPKL